LYGQANNKYFYMYNKNMNYFVRFFGLNHEVIQPECNNYIQGTTDLFLDKYQSRMNELTTDEDLIQLKSLLYACKRSV